MTGYEIMSKSLQKAADENKISQEDAAKQIRLYDFLNTCTDEDICSLFDTGAFNDIARSYLRKAATELVDEEVIDEDQAQAIKNRFSLLFSEKTASEV